MNDWSHRSRSSSSSPVPVVSCVTCLSSPSLRCDVVEKEEKIAQNTLVRLAVYMNGNEFQCVDVMEIESLASLSYLNIEFNRLQKYLLLKMYTSFIYQNENLLFLCFYFICACIFFQILFYLWMS